MVFFPEDRYFGVDVASFEVEYAAAETPFHPGIEVLKTRDRTAHHPVPLPGQTLHPGIYALYILQPEAVRDRLRNLLTPS